jgi:hypothetical protein
MLFVVSQIVLMPRRFEDRYAEIASRKQIPVCSYIPEYPQSERHCRMASSPGSFSKRSGF